MVSLGLVLCAHARQEKVTPAPKKSFLTLNSNDIKMTFGGELREQFFFYNHGRTLRSDYFDQNEFIRHKLMLDFQGSQGEKKFGKPGVQVGVKITNYMYWQQHGYYTPFYADPIKSTELESVTIARDLPVKSLVPLIYAEEAWVQVHFDAFTRGLRDHPLSFKIGQFPYIAGRGISLGYFNDLGVDYLGWVSEGTFPNYRYRAPGAVLKGQIIKDLTAEFYASKWRELNATMNDDRVADHAQWLTQGRMERGHNKDHNVLVTKLNYTAPLPAFSKSLIEPYWLYMHAPQQNIEVEGDASSYLHTLGLMFDGTINDFTINVEFAGQFGRQNIHALDRNVVQLYKDDNGFVKEVYSHINSSANGSGSKAFVTKELKALVNLPANRDNSNNGSAILKTDGTALVDTYNSGMFGNGRFRKEYHLDYQGFMALADVIYKFKNLPFKTALASGYISGDAYPYNEEKNQTFHGFVPLRTHYKGYSTENLLMFDEWIIPRPQTLSYRTRYAFNDTYSLSNLQFLGLGLTWYPLAKREKMSVVSDVMLLWESASIKKWDDNGTSSDATIETQLGKDRTSLGFKGWLSNKKASSFLGTELELKSFYAFMKDLTCFAKFCFFFPGQLYKDLAGQPNKVTLRKDRDGTSHYDGLGRSTVFGFVVELDYKF